VRVGALKGKKETGKAKYEMGKGMKEDVKVEKIKEISGRAINNIEE
jgi:hypothetical protein